MPTWKETFCLTFRLFAVLAAYGVAAHIDEQTPTPANPEVSAAHCALDVTNASKRSTASADFSPAQTFDEVRHEATCHRDGP
jgi:hypothetical protein